MEPFVTLTIAGKGGILMEGKNIIITIVIVLILGLATVWLLGNYVIDKYDIDRAISTLQLAQNNTGLELIL